MATVTNLIIDKIRKLLALSQSPNEHEAALAASRVQDLLADYNLSLAEVHAAGDKASKAKQEFTPREQKSHDKAAMYKYQTQLMEALARNNFCMHWIDEQWRPDPKGKKLRGHYQRNATTEQFWDKGRLVKVHMLLGSEVNVVTTQIIYDYLVETMDRLLPWQGMEKRGKDALLWLSGCTETLVERLNEQRYVKDEESRRAQAEAAKTGGTALVRLADLYNTEADLNNDAKWGYEPGTTGRKRRERELRYQAEAAREAELVAMGMNPSEAWYRARGFDVPAKEAEAKPETEAERREREREEAKQAKRDERRQQQSDARWERERAEERARRSHPAYQRGTQDGHNIGLDAQVKDNRDRGIN